ncbi:CD151 antigen [Octopus bimaculoides]|nr:CD151 antigen [Octopus bimaculoides]|eukprot:XP_014775897.1 PREDICTED: CD151 antigen-like [Octopus bimaculoides]
MSLKTINIVKLVFFILNTLFLVLGVVILALGIYLQISEAAVYMAVLPEVKFTIIVSLLVAAGIITIIVCILGFCAAFLESHCLLILYILCVSTIFCIEIAAGVIGLVRKNELETNLINKLVDNMKTSAKSWDIIQETYLHGKQFFDTLHSIRSLLCTSTNATPHEHLFNYQRCLATGTSMPSWLLNSGPALVQRNNRTSKYDPTVDRID